MKATFVLPGAANQPAGGSRMVFRYANAFAAAGWHVTVVMPVGLRSLPHWAHALRVGRYWLWRITQGYSPASWMQLHPRLRLEWAPDLAPHRAVPGDVVVATAVQTAEAVACWPDSVGRKFYFIQGHETWDLPQSRVESSWRLPLTKIAVSRWLCDLIAVAGEQAYHLPNGLDHEAFGLDRPIEDRRQPVLLWPHHQLVWKGTGDMQAVLPGLLAEVPGLKIRAFGTGAAPAHGVDIEYFRNPRQATLRRLYNEAAVFVAPSHSEGWGLPACEALQCGCGLAATDVGGHREFLRHGRNSLLHAPGEVTALAANVRRLLEDEPLRQRLAKQGLTDMQALRFDVSWRKLRSLLEESKVMP